MTRATYDQCLPTQLQNHHYNENMDQRATMTRYFNNLPCFIPLHPRTKVPRERNWVAKNYTLKQIEGLVDHRGECNIGIVLGSASGGLVDLDLDHHLAGTIGQMVLPETRVIFGRDGKPWSHRLYSVSEAGRTRQFVHPLTNAMLVEVRSEGAQTMYPGSVHDCGEQIRFEDGYDGQPGIGTYDALVNGAQRVAACCVIAECWQKGSRHKLALAFAGLCATSGVVRDDCLSMVGAICAAISDEEEDDRLRCVGTTYDQIDRGGVVAGNRDLIDHVGEHAFSKIQTWLGGSRPPVRTATHAPSRAAVFDPGTDISTGQAFSSSLNGDLIYSDREDQFYLREFDVYAPVSVHHVKSLAIGFIRNDSDPQLYQNVAAIKGSQSIKRVNAILEIAKTQLIADSHRFDSEPMLVGSRNGVIDLSIGAFSRPEGINTKRIGTYFDPGAKAPTFDSYLSAVFQGDIEKIEFIRRAVGYTLTGSVAAQCMFVLIGRGANGKSTFLNILRALLGDYAGTIMFQSLMVQKYANRVNDDIASLKGARFVSTQEGEVGQRLAVSRVKELTGGDTIQCRRLYEDFFYMKPEFKIWLSTNDLPDIPGGDDAIWRRLHIIDFPRVFGPDEQDPQLLNKLKAELPGILNWALEGIRQIGEMNGDFLNPPSSIREVTQLYRDDNDSVKKFMDECCSMKEGVKTMSSLLYRGYQGWCEYNGAAPVTARAFGLRLNELGIESRRTSSGIQRINIEMI